MSIEITFIENFITSNKRDVYLTYIRSKNKRGMFKEKMKTHLDLDPNLCSLIPDNINSPDQIETYLKEQGANSFCSVISAHNKKIPYSIAVLKDALDIVTNSDRAFLICLIPGKLAYYQITKEKYRYLLKNAKST